MLPQLLAAQMLDEVVDEHARDEENVDGGGRDVGVRTGDGLADLLAHQRQHHVQIARAEVVVYHAFAHKPYDLRTTTEQLNAIETQAIIIIIINITIGIFGLRF